MPARLIQVLAVVPALPQLCAQATVRVSMPSVRDLGLFPHWLLAALLGAVTLAFPGAPVCLWKADTWGEGDQAMPNVFPTRG